MADPDEREWRIEITERSLAPSLSIAVGGFVGERLGFNSISQGVTVELSPLGICYA